MVPAMTCSGNESLRDTQQNTHVESALLHYTTDRAAAVSLSAPDQDEPGCTACDSCESCNERQKQWQCPGKQHQLPTQTKTHSNEVGTLPLLQARCCDIEGCMSVGNDSPEMVETSQWHWWRLDPHLRQKLQDRQLSFGAQTGPEQVAYVFHKPPFLLLQCQH